MPERAGPLLVLERKLRSLGPPSLSTLIARLGDVEDYEQFVLMVREYLPESEQDIMRLLEPSAQMALFVERFSNRYFPLAEYVWEDEEDYSFLTRGIPVLVYGMGSDEYHNIATHYRVGYQLMAYLVQYDDPCGDEDDGVRVALADACAANVPPALLERVPEGGILIEEAHLLFDNTEYKGLAYFADIMSHSTGTDLLDLSEEDFWEMNPPDWDREFVDAVALEWGWVVVIQEEVDHMIEWLEEDPPARLEELLNFIENRRGEVNDGN